MKLTRHNPLFGHIQSFFDSYLRKIRGASPHTIRAYGNSLRLFFLFVAERKKLSISNLSPGDLNVENVLLFLNHIESKRNNGATTRNCRLAAIRSFTEHLLRNDITKADQYRKILAIPAKRAIRRPVTYLEPEEVREIIKRIGTASLAALRDRTLILFLYNTGSRVSEALAVCPRDLHLDRPRQVRLLGKGKKERYCPLWPETAELLKKLVSSTQSDQPVFSNQRGRPLTRDGVAHILSKRVEKAFEAIPQLRRKRITPHVLRHSCAVALLQSGVDLTVIRDYLGHASYTTTSHYVTSNLQMKTKVLRAFWKRAGLDRKSATTWAPSPDLLAYLESL